MQTVAKGFLTMCILILMGILLTMSIGTIMDYMLYVIFGFYDVMGWSMPEEYETLSAIMPLYTFMHILFRALPVIGVLVFVLSVFEKTRYDSYTAPEVTGEPFIQEEEFY